jgi:hypothetical protein
MILLQISVKYPVTKKPVSENPETGFIDHKNYAFIVYRDGACALLHLPATVPTHAYL